MTKVLNPNQEQALANLRSWYRSSSRFFILEGRAGTGKTFLMSILRDSIPTIDPLYTAPTNEAAKQLELVLPPKSPILTTYSALGFSFDTTIEDKTLIQRKEHKAIENCNTIIVDEASMVNDQLLEALIATQRKVLFVGHRSQLPAVKKQLTTFDSCESIVFQKNYPIFTLETPVRNTGTLFEFINHLEQIIYKGPRVFPALYKSSTKELRDYISTNEGRRAFYEEEAKVINYTNAETDAWNNKIRQSIHNTTHLPPYLPGDKLVLIEPSIQAGNLDRKTERQVLNAIGRDGVETLSSNSKVAIKEVGRANILGVACWKIITTSGDLLFIPMSFDDYKALRASLILRARHTADWKARQKAFENFHKLMSCFSNVKYSYAITTHRAQGMTIPEVWVNWRNIKTCHNVALKHKLLYVAASRVRDTLHIIG